jgi:hypothetical protein
VGFDDAAAVEVRDGATLALRTRPDVAGLNGSFLARVGWTTDGGTLFAGGNVWDGNSKSVLSWSDAGSGARRVAADGFVDNIAAIVPLPGGRLAVASFSGDIAVSALPDRTRLAERRLLGGGLLTNFDPASPMNRLRVAADGGVVEWVTYPAEQRLLRFDPARLDLRAGLRATHWNYRNDPKLNGRALTLEHYETALSASAAHNRLLLGAAWNLRLFAASGTQVWRQPIPGSAWWVNQSPDGRIVIAALGDLTIRWYRADNGRELLALYVTEDAQRWITFTPTGYYAAAPGAEHLIGWHVNRGPDEAADFFPASRFRDRFYRPDVVSRVLATLDEAEALKQADAARGIATRPAQPITEDLPPVVSIVSPLDGTRINGGEVTLEYTVRSPSGKPLSGITLLVDGQRPGFAAVPDLPVITGKDRETKGRLAVPVPQGKTVEIGLLASTTRDGEPVRIRITSTAPVVDLGLPRLNGVLVGVAHYPRPDMKLNFADKDARDMAALFERQRQLGQYRDVDLHIVPEAKATRKGILAELRALRDRNTDGDVALIFFSGHGAQVGQRTFFLPIDADPDDPDTTAISKADLLDILSDIKGTKLVFLDICHAGAFQLDHKPRIVPDMTALAAEFSDPRRGLVVYASSTLTQPSEELPQGNGAFTEAVVEGLKGAAAVGRHPTVTMTDLDVYVTFRVRQLTDGRQFAKMVRPADIPDLPVIALAR